MGEKSWTETPELVKEKLAKVFPKLAEHYEILEPVLSYLSDPKPPYQIGFVIPLKGKDIPTREGCIIYYPIKDSFVRRYNSVGEYPVADYGKIYNTKRGAMKIVETRGKASVQFAKSFQEIK